MERAIEAVVLGLWIDAEADRQIDHLEQHERDDDGPRRRCTNRDRLLRKELEAAAIAAVVDAFREQARQQRAGGAADAVDAERIERIVVTEARLEEHAAVA